MLIFAAIDGTGVFSDKDYAKEFKNSFVNRFSRKAVWAGNSYYQRGPSNDGFSTASKANYAAKYVRDRVDIQMKIAGSVQPGVFLSGYSRGAAAAISAAQTLGNAKIRVDCLLLFDAVDRSLTVGRLSIPPNVSTCYHAVRDPVTGSRDSFDNCGRTWTKPTSYVERLFHCTHGGIGGLPYATGGATGAIKEPVGSTTNVTPDMDQAISAKVWMWMDHNFIMAMRIYQDRVRKDIVRINTRDIEIIGGFDDNLSKLAMRFYGDSSKWRGIVDRNFREFTAPYSASQPCTGKRLIIPDVIPDRQGDLHTNLNPRMDKPVHGGQMRPE